MKLLVVEDEARMVELLRKGLCEEGHTVVCAGDGDEGLDLARNYEFDVIILDVMMPKLNGHEVAQRLRSEHIATPLLMLTAKDSVPDLVRGLDSGADDYLTKPFAFEELLARLRAVKRRAPVPSQTKLQVGNLVRRSRGARSFPRRHRYPADSHGVQPAGAADVSGGKSRAATLAHRGDLGVRPRDRGKHARCLRSTAADQDRYQGSGEADPHGAGRGLHDQLGGELVKRLSIGLRLTTLVPGVSSQPGRADFWRRDVVHPARQPARHRRQRRLAGQIEDVRRFLESNPPMRRSLRFAGWSSRNTAPKRGGDYLQILDAGGTGSTVPLLSELPLPAVRPAMFASRCVKDVRMGKEPFRLVTQSIDVHWRSRIHGAGGISTDEEDEPLERFQRYLLMFAPLLLLAAGGSGTG